jgi:hypothetical protein
MSPMEFLSINMAERTPDCALAIAGLFRVPPQGVGVDPLSRDGSIHVSAAVDPAFGQQGVCC